MSFNDTFTTSKINSTNRVYISKRVLNKLNLKIGDELQIFADVETREIKLKPIE